MKEDIQLTEEEIEELIKFSIPSDMFKDMIEHVFDLMEEHTLKNNKLQRKWWIKITDKYNLDLKNGKLIADSLRGIIKIK